MKILSLAENLLNFQFHDFFPTGHGFETVEFGGCKLAYIKLYFHYIKKKLKIEKQGDHLIPRREGIST
jgi:hypothetical protein